MCGLLWRLWGVGLEGGVNISAAVVVLAICGINRWLEWLVIVYQGEQER